MTGQKRPLITANRVTVARLLPMPLVAWLFYRGETGWWWAFGLAVLIASTDFVDGWLARKHGPTVLGGLLDPIADKVFVALTFLPLVDVGYFPALAVVILFIREFAVTSLRSAYELRGIRFKTSYLGKVKTWTQMQAMISLMVFALVKESTFVALIAGSAVVPAGMVAWTWLSKKRLWKGALIGALLPIPMIAIIVVPDQPRTTIDIVMYAVAALTLASGLDYVVVGLPKLKQAGGSRLSDWVRVIGALAIPITAIYAMTKTDATAGLVFAIIAIELAVGGLDNLLSHHKDASGPLAWGGRTIGVAILCGVALLVPEHANALVATALGISVIGAGAEFVRGRAYYMERRRDERPSTPQGMSEPA